MQLQSLGILTDLIVQRLDVTVIDRGGYVVVRTPSHPSFFWGNYLVLPAAPADRDLDEWSETFAREFARQPESSHRSFTWEARGMTDPASAEAARAFERRGYDYDVSVVLSTSEVSEPKHPNHDLDYRPLVAEREWEQLLDLHVEVREAELDETAYRAFARTKLQSWRRAIEAGHGVWFGAFARQRLVAGAGLYWRDGLGRFQNVCTTASQRRKGICGTLIHGLSRHGLDRRGLGRLVMAADEAYHAARIYESLGFAPTERVGCLGWYDRAAWGSPNRGTPSSGPVGKP